MRNVFAFFAAVGSMLLMSSFAAAQAPAAPSFAPIGMGITVLGIGLGLGLIGIGAMGGIARQPEQAGTIRTAMLIIGGLVEGAGILALVFCLVAK
jgi:F-type H+-transporting ATPase subunit c